MGSMLPASSMARTRPANGRGVKRERLLLLGYRLRRVGERAVIADEEIVMEAGGGRAGARPKCRSFDSRFQ